MEAGNPGNTLVEARNLSDVFELDIKDVKLFSSYYHCSDKLITIASDLEEAKLSPRTKEIKKVEVKKIEDSSSKEIKNKENS